jgi:hypothetical protein
MPTNEDRPVAEASETNCHETDGKKSWLVQIFAWVDRLGDLWITKLKLHCKDVLTPVSCGSSYFQQTVADFRRIDSYPLNEQGNQAPASELPRCPATKEYKAKVAGVIESFEKKFAAQQLTWDDYYELQALMLPLYPERELRGRHVILRDQFSIRAPQHLITMYEKSAPPPIAPNTAYKEILEDALYLQRAIASIDTYRPHQELKRNTITFELFVSLIFVVLVEFAVGLIVWAWLYVRHIWYNPEGHFAFPFIVIVMMLGALGAAVSSQRRLQDSFDQDSSLLNSTRYVGSGVGTKLAPFQGSVFAAVLLFLLYSGLLNTALPTVNPPAAAPPPPPPPAAAASEPDASSSTDVADIIDADDDNGDVASPTPTVAVSNPSVPTVSPTLSATSASPIESANLSSSVTPTPSPAESVSEAASAPKRGNLISRAMLFLFGPSDTVEYAKILVYAFLAGFAERLVPDTLDRLTRGKS